MTEADTRTASAPPDTRISTCAVLQFVSVSMSPLLEYVQTLANVEFPAVGASFAPCGERLTVFLANDYHIGFLTDDLLDAFRTSPAFVVKPNAVLFADDNASFEEHSEALAALGQCCVKQGLAKLGAEDSMVYAGGAAFARVDRQFKHRLNMHTLATNLVASTQDGRIWVGVRAANKTWCPGMLDNVAGGGLRPVHPLENMIEEAHEEASIDRDWARANIKESGYISAVNVYKNELCIDIDYCYECVLPSGMRPVPLDGEVADFRLLSIDEVKRSIEAGLWMPDAALVMIDWLHRHGHLRDDPDEARIVELLRHPMYRIPNAAVASIDV